MKANLDHNIDFTAYFRALSDKTRLRIFYLLCKLKTELAVCEIMDAIAESQYNVSRHLQVLKRAGLICENKQGRWVLYSINKENNIVQRLKRTMLDLKSDYFENDLRRGRARLKKRSGGKTVFCLRI